MKFTRWLLRVRAHERPRKLRLEPSEKQFDFYDAIKKFLAKHLKKA